MAHLFVEIDGTGDWAVWPLAGGAFRLSERGVTALGGADPDDSVGRSALLVRGDGGPQPRWVLLSASQSRVRVNGAAMILGARVLRHRDEILLRDAEWAAECRCFYSAERLARTEPFPAGDGLARCPRCKQAIETGDLAVQCPGANCGAWHHQTEDLPCWTYHDTCAVCDQPTDLEQSYRWTPEEL